MFSYIENEDFKKRLFRDIKIFLKNDKKKKNGCQLYKNLPEDEKQRLAE